MAKVTWGVIGCSSIARNRSIPAMLDAPSVEVIAIASRTASKAHEMQTHFHIPRAYASYEALIADRDIEAVYISLPNALHAEWSILALLSGKHVVCEKPMASNAAETVRVADAAASSGRKVMEAFMWRFHPQHERALAAVRSGDIGTVRLVKGAFTFVLEPMEDARMDHTLQAGSVMDVGCYPISAARYYFGSEPSLAVARGDVHPEYATDMSMCGILDFPAGRALIESGFHLPERTDLQIIGEKGVIRIPRAWVPDDAGSCIEIDGRQVSFGPCNQYTQQFERFSQAVLAGTRAPFGPEDAIRQMRAVDAIRRSIRNGGAEAV